MAAAVVLFEMGNYYYRNVGGNIILTKDVYKKIKIFDSKKFNGSTINIPLQTTAEGGEIVAGYSAFTYNDTIKSEVKDDAVFLNGEAEYGQVFSIEFPNVQDGSIIEYTYRIQSPFLFSFEGWDFQAEIPKIYSEFLFTTPIEVAFKSVLYGSKPLDIKENKTIGDCVRLINLLVPSDIYNSFNRGCPQFWYAMKDVPAFVEEDYMLSPKNYISRVELETDKILMPGNGGKIKNMARTWQNIDEQFAKDDFFGAQLSKKGFFKRKLPDALFEIADDLEKAKAIYYFIQDHYSWNGTFYNPDMLVKDSFDQKTGSIPEINISLINALKAANLNANLMLLSTRESGLPIELYPVLNKFNYTIAVLKIGDQSYLLDASSKEAAFGIIPFQALNVKGRAMDIKNGSYWMDIEPFAKNIYFANAQITADTAGNFYGNVSISNYGYIALYERKNIAQENIETYKREKLTSDSSIEIEDYKFKNIKELEKPLIENYNISIEPEIASDKILLYPFFTKNYFSENPFTEDERIFPIDLGFPFTNTYIISIDLANAYEVESLPESRTLKLPNEDGEFTVTYITEGTKINVRLNFKLSTYRYKPEAYQSLKELFAAMISALKNEPITLKKL